MTQVPLAPPPPTGGPLDGWLYLLWRRLTQAGQILWGSITPGTSADVAAVVTDETGSPGSLVFSGNPTLAGITNSGNLTFTGTGTRIVGDFSNATFANRAMWQTSTADSSTTLGIIPNGTGPNGTLNLYNNSDPTNAGRLALTCGIGEAAIFSTIHGSGTYVPLGVYVNNVETARFAVSGVTTFGGISTAPALKVTPIASQARWIEVTGATSSGNPTIGTSGGALKLRAGGVDGIIVNPDSTADTYIEFVMPPTGNNYTSFVSRGTATDIGMFFSGKGSGAIGLFTGSLGALQAAITHTASADRYLLLTGSSGGNPSIGTSGGNLSCTAVFMPKQATTAGAPAHVVGGVYFDTTLNKLRIGGTAGWETVTSV